MTFDIQTGRGMRILDLFSGAGGAAMGLHRAFPEAEIVGVDIKPQLRYPFTFVQADILATGHGLHMDYWDFVWMSPPCQAYTNQGKVSGKQHPRLIQPMRDRWKRINRCESIKGHKITPWVIENVIGAPLQMPVMLCGSMFGLGVRRHRNFETNFLWQAPTPCDHKGREVRAYYGAWGREAFRAKKPGNKDTLRGTLERAPQDMGIDWMEWHELTQAIPPAYSRYIGEQLKLHLAAANASRQRGE
jgi:DNA (cytosine-5)-methyltransferase 1